MSRYILPAIFEAPCDVFITEATFGLPIYRWDPSEVVMKEIFEWWEQNRKNGRTSMLFTYALGKAQRVLAGLQEFTDQTVSTKEGLVYAIADAFVIEFPLGY